MSSENVSESRGSQLTVYVCPVGASPGLSVWCNRDILAGYHLGSVGSIRAKTGVPGGRGRRGGVGAGTMSGLKAVTSYVTSSEGVWFGCRGGVPTGRMRAFWFCVVLAPKPRGRFSPRFCVWAFVASSVEEWCVLPVKEERREEGLERALLLCGVRELMSSSVVCCACAV